MRIAAMKEFGSYIRNVRKSQGLTQADLAAAANTGVRFLVDLENGKETVQAGRMLRVCRELGIKIDVSDNI